MQPGGAFFSLDKLTKEGGSAEERKKRFSEDAAAVAKWDFERIIPCHGDVIENVGKKAWLSAYANFISEDGSPKF